VCAVNMIVILVLDYLKTFSIAYLKMNKNSKINAISEFYGKLLYKHNLFNYIKLHKYTLYI